MEVYFDNVGGEILDLMLLRMARHGRVAACGAVSNYNKSEATGLKNWYEVISKSSLLFQYAPTCSGKSLFLHLKSNAKLKSRRQPYRIERLYNSRFHGDRSSTGDCEDVGSGCEGGEDQGWGGE